MPKLVNASSLAAASSGLTDRAKSRSKKRKCSADGSAEANFAVIEVYRSIIHVGCHRGTNLVSEFSFYPSRISLSLSLSLSHTHTHTHTKTLTSPRESSLTSASAWSSPGSIRQRPHHGLQLINCPVQQLMDTDFFPSALSCFRESNVSIHNHLFLACFRLYLIYH